MASVNWTNVTDFGQLPSEANNVSGGSFWVSMFFMLWIIMMLLLINWGFEVAILVSSFVFLVIGLLLAYTNLIAWQWVLVQVGVLVCMFFYIIWSSRKIRS